MEKCGKYSCMLKSQFREKNMTQLISRFDQETASRRHSIWYHWSTLETTVLGINIQNYFSHFEIHIIDFTLWNSNIKILLPFLKSSLHCPWSLQSTEIETKVKEKTVYSKKKGGGSSFLFFLFRCVPCQLYITKHCLFIIKEK